LRLEALVHGRLLLLLHHVHHLLHTILILLVRVRVHYSWCSSKHIKSCVFVVALHLGIRIMIVQIHDASHSIRSRLLRALHVAKAVVGRFSTNKVGELILSWLAYETLNVHYVFDGLWHHRFGWRYVLIGYGSHLFRLFLFLGWFIFRVGIYRFTSGCLVLLLDPAFKFVRSILI
jgi:hypothetical protein